jgi:xylulokinase
MFGGIDIGTSSIKVIIINLKGEVISFESYKLPTSKFYCTEDGFQCHEQNPIDWWEGLIKILQTTTKNLKKKDLDLNELSGFSISSTSGTIIALDTRDNSLLSNAIMHNDCRAQKEAKEINSCSQIHCNKLGYKFSAPFAISKILWLINNNKKAAEYGKFIHANDFIVGKLTNNFYKSDFSHSLKTGFDLIEMKWPTFIEESLKIPIKNLPDILKPGDYIASTTSEIQKVTGIPKNTPLYAGVTDSTAGLIASGAIDVGNLYSALGSTIVEKVITPILLKYDQARIYSHKFPTGNWILGGAGNCGTLTLNERFGFKKLDKLDKEMLKYIPTNTYVYPLINRGERFPFNNPYAEGFEIGAFKNKAHKYAGYIEGLCYIEKMMLNVFEDLGAKCDKNVYTVGGGTKSNNWMELRATILNKLIRVPKIPEAAFGGAIIVASTSYYNNDLNKACKSLVKIEKEYLPNKSLVDIYERKYTEFDSIIQEKIENKWKND